MDKDIMFQPFPAHTTTDTSKSAMWVPVSPIPSDAPDPPSVHPRNGKPSAIYNYRDFQGCLLASVCRFEEPDSGKSFAPRTYWRNSETNQTQWRWKAPLKPWPLYGIDGVTRRPNAPVILCEGEKAADAAKRLLPKFVVVSSWGGSRAASNSDWRPLANREVVIWPDADAPGLKYANEAGQQLNSVGAQVRVLTPPADCVSGWDAADAEAEGWTDQQATRLIDSATRPELRYPPKAGLATPIDANSTSSRQTDQQNKEKKSPSQKEILIGLANTAELWHTPDRKAYASFPVGNHVENAQVRSRGFRLWLIHQFYRTQAKSPGNQATEEALRAIEAHAIYASPQHTANRRVASLGDALYIDLGDDIWSVIEVTSQGWQVTNRTPVKFIRNQAMRALPEPEINDSLGGIEQLRTYINLANESDLRLIVSWLLAALAPSGPYPILIVTGQQGSAKSTVTRLLREFVDPSRAPIRVLPSDDRDLMISAVNNHVLAYDNVSSIPPWLSDALCRIATGGGFATRELHTDMDEVVMDAMRPIIFNGITDLVSRPDLGERAIVVDLKAIPSETRRSETDFWQDFEKQKPALLGALMDGLVSALKHRDGVTLTRMPRLADYGIWVTAAEAGLGWPTGSIMEDYWQNREAALHLEIENNDLAQAVKSLVAEKPWSGPASALREELDALVPETTRRLRSWPKTAAVLGRSLTRLVPILRAVGISAVMHRDSSGRRWDIKKLGHSE